MAQHSRVAIGRAAAFFLLAVVVSILTFGPLARRSTGQVDNSPALELAKLGFKFNGASTCDTANCHEKAGSTAPPKAIGQEYTIWKGPDSHSDAYKTLGNKASTAIATKLSETRKTKVDAKTDASCLNCHSLNVDKELQGAEFKLAEGNSCESCHGPSGEKLDENKKPMPNTGWLAPHDDKGWLQQQYAQHKTHEALLKNVGIFDTEPLGRRAALCTSCHLAIDADLVEAGHPQTKFELDTFSNTSSGKKQWRHWREEGELFAARQWLAGQTAQLHDAMRQLEKRKDAKPELVKPAYQQAMAHLMVVKHAAAPLGMDAAAVDQRIAAMKSASTDAGKLATEAQAVAKMAETAMSKADDIKVDKAAVTKLMNDIAADEKIVAECGKFGMQQQAWAIRAMYRALQKVEDPKDATLAMIDDKLAPFKKDVSAADYGKALADVKAKLPK